MRDPRSGLRGSCRDHGAARPRESARAVYRSHVLEHLALNEFRQTLRNVHFDLVPVVRSAPCSRILNGWRILKLSSTDSEADFKNMARELEAAGFTDIRRAQCRDNPEPRFHDVEEFSR